MSVEAPSDDFKAVKSLLESPPCNDEYFVPNASSEFKRLTGDELEAAWNLGVANLHLDIRATRTMLGRRDDPRLPEVFRAARAHPDVDDIVAIQLDTALWALGDEAAHTRTVSGLEDAEPEVLRAGIQGLRYIRSADAVALADTFLNDESPSVRAMAFDTLFEMLGVPQSELPSRSYSDEFREIMTPFPTLLSAAQQRLRAVFRGRTVVA